MPVYFTDGTRAPTEDLDETYSLNEYWNRTEEEASALLAQYDIVSFDLFDTLIMRNVFFPQDVWAIMDRIVRHEWGWPLNFLEWRKTAAALSEPYADIFSIYASRHESNHQLSEDDRKRLVQLEFETELSVALPRQEMVRLFHQAQSRGKRTYILSDMHLPGAILLPLLEKCGITAGETNIWVSCEKKTGKADGGLWEMFIREIPDGKKALHIGDDVQADAMIPRKFSVDSHAVMSAACMLEHSSLSSVPPRICSQYASFVMGKVAAALCSNPFAFSKSKGKITLEDEYVLGYCVFGPVVYTFLRWLEEMTAKHEVEQLLFFARDGYFLHLDYLYMTGLKGGSGTRSIYLEISRRAAMVAAVQSIKDLEDVVRFPYNGCFADFMSDRFSLAVDKRSGRENGAFISTINDFRKVMELCLRYEDEIQEEAARERKAYLEYLGKIDFNRKTACVDLFLYGHTQYYLSKLLNRNLLGFHMAADISPQNRCLENNRLIPCFQDALDVNASKCMIHRNCNLLESFLTAPNGMLMKIGEHGEFLYGKTGKNQEYFDARIRMNCGVQRFIHDMSSCGGDRSVPDRNFIDAYYGAVTTGGMELSEKLREYFYFDNSLIHRREFRIYE